MPTVLTEQPILYEYTAGGGQTDFAISCRVFSAYLDAFTVAVNGEACAYAALPTNNREFAVDEAPGGAEGGPVIFGAGLTGGDDVRIQRTLPVERITNFQESGPVDMADVNLELTRQVAIEQDGRSVAPSCA